MTIFEEYRQKMSGRGVGFLEFYLWIFCPLLVAYHIYDIVKYASGKQAFEAGAFLYSLLITMVAVLVVATGLFLSKLTFWIDIALPAIYLIGSIIDLVKTFIAAFNAAKAAGTTFLASLFGALGGIVLFAQFIAMAIFAIALFYFIDHKDIFGY